MGLDDGLPVRFGLGVASACSSFRAGDTCVGDDVGDDVVGDAVGDAVAMH